MQFVKWACPKCGAEPNACGRGGSDDCNGHMGCEGFLCNCDGIELAEHHGETHKDPCPHAECHHCGWEGTFPVPPRGIQAWEKKALAAGWTPPTGWSEAIVQKKPQPRKS